MMRLITSREWLAIKSDTKLAAQTQDKETSYDDYRLSTNVLDYCYYFDKVRTT